MRENALERDPAIGLNRIIRFLGIGAGSRRAEQVLSSVASMPRLTKSVLGKSPLGRSVLDGPMPGKASLIQLVNAYGAYLAALVVRGLELVGKLGLYMLAARLLGVHEAGLFFLCTTWIGLISTLARAGYEKAAMRHLAAELAVGKGQEARRALVASTLAVTVGGVLTTLLTLALAYPMATYAFKDETLTAALIVSAASILPQTWCVFVGHALVGLGRGVSGQFIQNGLWPVLTLVAIGLGARSLDGILYAWAFANFASAVVGTALLLRERGRFARTAHAAPAAAEPLPALWRTAWPLSIVELVQVGLNSLPVLLLASFGMPAEVGAFSVAQRMSLLVWVVVTSIGTIAAPAFAASHRVGDWPALRALNTKVRLAVAVFGLPVVAAMLVMPATLLEIIGPGFEIAAAALVIMALGQLVSCFLPSQDIVLAMTGHGSVLRWLNAAQLLSCCLLCAVLIPLYGMNGAAIATAIFMAQGAIGTALAVRRLLPGVL